MTVPLPGIDPDLAWDDDGACWFTYTASPGPDVPTAIMQARIDPETGEVLAPPRRLWSGSGLAYPEAPHLYQANGQWYLMIAEGGTERGHAVSIARGPHPWGPFEGHPHNPVLSHRSTTSPIQSTGHADLVQTPDGDWYAVLLATRPRGGTPAFHVLGRETFLTPVRWSTDGWPIPDPVSEGTRQAQDVRIRDEFEGGRLGAAWVSLRRPVAQAGGLAARPGWLTLSGSGHSLDQPLAAFVGQRQRHLRFAVRVLIDASAGAGGLVLRIDERHYYAIEAGAGRVRCIARIGPLAQEVGAVGAAGDAVLAIEGAPTTDGFVSPGSPPDLIRLGVVQGGEFRVLGESDGRYLSTEVAGGFTGRVVGMYATAGTVAFDWFEYEGARSGARPCSSRWCSRAVDGADGDLEVGVRPARGRCEADRLAPRAL